MLSELVAFDSFSVEPCASYDVEKDVSETSFAPSGENLSRAGGSAINVSGFGDRIFLWRSDFDKLTIHEISFIREVNRNSMELNFSNAKILNCGIYYEKSGLYVLASTTDGVYQHCFASYEKTNKLESILNNYENSESQFYPFKGLSPQGIICSTTFRYMDEYSLFGFGLKGGSVIIVSISEAGQVINELTVSTHHFSLLSGIFPLSARDVDGLQEHPISVAFLANESTLPNLVCVSKDHYFRAWDLKYNQCISSIDLLKCLNKYSSSFENFTYNQQRNQAFAPGLNHCIKSIKNFALIYLELQPTKKISSPSPPMSFWIWIKSSIMPGRKVNFEVIRVERIEQMPVFQSSYSASVSSLIDFSPHLIYENSLNASGDETDATSPKNEVPTSLGVWSLIDLPNSEGSSQPALHSELYNLDPTIISLKSASTAIGNTLIQSWQEPLPQSVFQPQQDDDRSNMFDETENNCNVSAFLDFIFMPGRFTKEAICKAFKTLRHAQSLDDSSLSPDDGLARIRESIRNLLLHELSYEELSTALRTFHQSIVDYHQRSLEPLGLFCVQSTGDVIVVHRSGISVTRPLQSAEEALLNPYYLTSDAVSIESRGKKHLLSNCRKIVKSLAQNQLWLEHERHICDIYTNFQHTESILDQVINELKSGEIGKLFVSEPDDSMDRLEAAFNWILELISSSDDSEELEESAYDKDGSQPTIGIFSTLSAELLARGVRQATITRLRFTVALYILWRRCNCHSYSNFEASSSFENRLYLVYRCLAIVQWLSVTRSLPDPEINDLRQPWALLKILGINCQPKKGVPASTLLEELLLTFPEFSDGFPNAISWREHTSKIITILQRRLCPTVSYGKTMLPVLKYLLFNAKTLEILKLCKCLAPNAFSGIDLEKLIAKREGYEEAAAKKTRLDLVTESWWPGDLNALYTCAFLAFACSKYAHEAMDQHIEGSLYLRNRLLSQFHPSACECPQELAINDSLAIPCSLLEKLFPGEFSLSSLGLSQSVLESQSPISMRYLVDEVQIRYLIKAMTVLELIDKPECVISLCEYGLEIIRNAAEAAREEDLLSFGPIQQLTSLLLGNSEMSMDSAEAPVNVGMQTIGSPTNLFPVSTIRTEDVAFRTIAQHLSELEAVLRTRIFRHELNLGNIDRAHELVMTNPDKAKQRDCLHLLITELCDHHMAPRLVNLEYGPLENELISTLESRARASDVLPKSLQRRQTLRATIGDGQTDESQEREIPGNIFYDVLYAYYVRRSRFHSAAEVCFEQAIRLAEEATLLPPTFPRRARFDGNVGDMGSRALLVLQHQAFCLADCINALELLPAKDQWIIRPDTNIAFMDIVEPHDLKENITWAFYGTNEVLSEIEDPSSMGEVEPDVPIRHAEGRKIFQLVDLKYQYLVVQARLRLTQVSRNYSILRGGTTSPPDLYSALIATALYDEAFKLLLAFNLDSDLLITAIASRCVALTEAKQSSNDGLPPYLPALTNVTSPLSVERDLVIKSIAWLSDYFNPNRGLLVEVNRKNDLLDLYWSLLKVVLTNVHNEGAITRGSKWNLHLLACKILLTGPLNQPASTIQLPGWLMQLMLSSGQSGPVVPLLRILIDHKKLREACRLALALLASATGPETGQCPALSKKADLHLLQLNLHSAPKMINSSIVYIPHGLLFHLMDSLAAIGQNDTSYFY
nr:nuclear pore complex protein Nup160 [Hymenolepis microstoma]